MNTIVKRFSGLSSEGKPKLYRRDEGSTFYEIDTETAFTYKGGLWVKDTVAPVVESNTLTAEVILTPAQVRDLFNTHVELLPAPGVGKAIMPINLTATIAFNSVPYTNTSTIEVNPTGYVPGGGRYWNFLVPTESVDTVHWGSYSTTYARPSIQVNQGLSIMISSDLQNLNGDSPIKITIVYKVITL